MTQQQPLNISPTSPQFGIQSGLQLYSVARTHTQWELPEIRVRTSYIGKRDKSHALDRWSGGPMKRSMRGRRRESKSGHRDPSVNQLHPSVSCVEQTAADDC